MTNEQKDNLLKGVVAAIDEIKAQYEMEVIKHHTIQALVNPKTGEFVGIEVKMQLITRYDYGEEIFTKWKKLLKAEHYYIHVCRNQLHIMFSVKFNKTK